MNERSDGRNEPYIDFLEGDMEGKFDLIFPAGSPKKAYGYILLETDFKKWALGEIGRESEGEIPELSLLRLKSFPTYKEMEVHIREMDVGETFSIALRLSSQENPKIRVSLNSGRNPLEIKRFDATEDHLEMFNRILGLIKTKEGALPPAPA